MKRDRTFIFMDEQGRHHRQASSATDSKSPTKLKTSELGVPLRRRVLRACDHCRRRKTKCNGEENCDKCLVIGFSCTYGHELKQSRGPKYVAHLEQRVEELENDAQGRGDSGSTSVSATTDDGKIADWRAAVMPMTLLNSGAPQCDSPPSLAFPGGEYPQDGAYLDSFASNFGFDSPMFSPFIDQIHQMQDMTYSTPWINQAYNNSTMESISPMDMNNNISNPYGDYRDRALSNRLPDRKGS